MKEDFLAGLFPILCGFIALLVVALLCAGAEHFARMFAALIH